MNIIFKSSRRAVTAAIIASLMGIFNACHRHGHGAAENHMHRHNFDELVKHFEDPARDQWQKPDAVIALIAAHLQKHKLASPVVADLGLPGRLRDANVPRELLPKIAEESMHDLWVKTNPRPISGPPVVLELLEAAW